MQLGKRSAAWDYTAALITHIRLAAGDKEAKPQLYHPYACQSDERARFKKLMRENRK